MLNSLERSHQVLENPNYNPEFVLGREITEEEENALSLKMDKVRFWATAKGIRIDYPNDGEYPDGYLKELEISVVPGGNLRAGADVLYSYSERNVFAYLSLSLETGIIRFNEFFKSSSSPISHYSFSVNDLHDKNRFRIDPEPLGRMRLGVYDVVIEMAGTLIDRAQTAFLLQETTAGKSPPEPK